MKFQQFLSTFALSFLISWNGFAKPTEGVWRVVVVAATAEVGIQEGATAFVQYTRQEVSRLADVLNLSLELTVIQGKDLQPARLESTLQALQQAPATQGKKMLTWISFSHGFNTMDANSTLPYLVAHPTKTALAPQEIRYAFSIEKIYTDLVESKAYDHVHVWAELCNNICVGCQQMPNEGLVGLSAVNKKGLEHLLYSVKGEIIVSSSYGQASCSTSVGGPFSRALFEALSMVEMGDIQAPTTFEGKQGFITMVQELSQAYLQQLPALPCQSQTPQGYVGLP